MLNNFHPNVKATIAFLKLLKVNVNPSTVNEALQNHPDWPSLLSLSDSLTKWHVPNAAAKSVTHSIDELPLPCIICTNDREVPLAIITAVTDSILNVLHNNYQKPTVEQKDNFLKKWNGIYLVAEPDEYSGETHYKENRKKELAKSLISIAALLSILSLLLFLFINKINGATSIASFSLAGLYIQAAILFTGTIVTTLLLWYEIDKNNTLLKKVCTGIAKGNCNAILTSKQSKVFSWLSWSEVGFFYFAGGLMTLLLSGDLLTDTLPIIAGMNLLVLPYILFSVYYQWKIAKQWCILCIAVQALLLAGGINIILSDLFSLPAISLKIIPITAFLYLVTPLLWFALKPLILKLQEAKNIKREYQRTKFNIDIFETLLKGQNKIGYSAEEIGIILGNPSATNELIKVCNPYCAPCSKAHPKIEKLLSENQNLVKAKIIFTATSKEKDPRADVAKHFLAIASKKDMQLTLKALDDWYLTEKKDYKIFAAKYPLDEEIELQTESIVKMEKWCRDNKVTFTPTFFFNGYQLPDVYDIEDLQYFLLE